MSRIIFLIAAAMMLCSVSAYAQDSIRIAVMDLKADGVPEKIARTVSNMIRTELINTGNFSVVDRTQMDQILKEQGFQKTGCTDQKCAVQLGRLMSARKMVVGEYMSLA